MSAEPVTAGTNGPVTAGTTATGAPVPPPAADIAPTTGSGSGAADADGVEASMDFVPASPVEQGMDVSQVTSPGTQVDQDSMNQLGNPLPICWTHLSAHPPVPSSRPVFTDGRRKLRKTANRVGVPVLLEAPKGPQGKQQHQQRQGVMEDILGDNARLRKKVGQLEALVRSLEDRIGSMSSEVAQVGALVRSGVQQGDLNAVKDQVQQVKNNIAFGVSNLQGSVDDITNKVLDNGAAISSVKKDVSNIKGEVSAVKREVAQLGKRAATPLPAPPPPSQDPQHQVRLRQGGPRSAAAATALGLQPAGGTPPPRGTSQGQPAPT